MRDFLDSRASIRPRTMAAIVRYPAIPVVYRRPFIQILAALMLGATTTFMYVLLLWPPDDRSDQVAQQDWWVPLAFLVVVGGLYLAATSWLRVDQTHVRIRNPFRSVDIPLSHIVNVEPGRHLKVATTYGHFYALGVEAARIQYLTGSYGTQCALAELIIGAAQDASSDREPEGHYRWASPDIFFCVCAVALVVASVIIVAGG